MTAASVYPEPHPGAPGLWRGLRVGLLGGSFNPAHAGHRHIAEEALRRLGLDVVWWLVSPQNPLKSVAEMAPAPVRVARARAVADHPRMVVTALEERLGTCFTRDTLAELRRRFPGVRFVWLMGGDNLLQMPHWQGWTQIFATVPVAVLDRSPYSVRMVGGKAFQRYRRRTSRSGSTARLADRRPPALAILRIRRHPASATAIRRNGGLPMADRPHR